jgi:toxin ParE1/3/4
LIWRAEGRAALRTIISYIAERNPAAAADLNDRIRACAERLSEHPFLYRTGRVRDTREALVHPNYVLIYRVTTDTIEIVDVLHSRRQYPPSV